MTEAWWTELDQYLFHEGAHVALYEKMGAFPLEGGVRFSVYAPHAQSVAVAGDWNSWSLDEDWLIDAGDGVFTGFIEKASVGQFYKYAIHTTDGRCLMKADPLAAQSELRPGTASVIHGGLDYPFQHDDAWQAVQPAVFNRPMMIYEAHAGSWRRHEDGRFLTYRELGDQLAVYLADMGYTHVEFMPLLEHPLDRSWGYQATGFFSPTSRYGTPEDLAYMIDTLHSAGIGVLFDWIPGHFCRDAHGLRLFDGECLYEPEHPLRRENPQWGTTYFAVEKPEVRSFLLSSALSWLARYHIDGFRLDAVSSLLYLNYGKEPGQWAPEPSGSAINSAAVAFLADLNTRIFGAFPGALMMAEESTDFPQVTWPTETGGLGFNYKWNMGWMNDVLSYFAKDPLLRRHHHTKLTFSLMYAFAENFVLPLSHDEVVHGKASLLAKMPGDDWQKFANFRLLLGYMITHPGKKLLFMGQDLAPWSEWSEMRALDWPLLAYERHQAFHRYVKALLDYYRRTESLWDTDFDWRGFTWLEPDDAANSLLSFLRNSAGGETTVVVCNFTPVVRENYRIGVPKPGVYKLRFNSDEAVFGGSGLPVYSRLIAQDVSWHNQPCSLAVRVPPLAVICLSIEVDHQEEAQLCQNKNALP